MEILAKQLPSMKQRIHDAYKNTREFVNFINDTLPEAKINFVSEMQTKGKLFWQHAFPGTITNSTGTKKKISRSQKKAFTTVKLKNKILLSL